VQKITSGAEKSAPLCFPRKSFLLCSEATFIHHEFTQNKKPAQLSRFLEAPPRFELGIRVLQTTEKMSAKPFIEPKNELCPI